VDHATLSPARFASTSLNGFRDRVAGRDSAEDQSARDAGCDVLVAMPDDVVRCGLASMLSALPNVANVFSCESPTAAIEELARSRPSVALVTCTDLACCNGRLAHAARRHGTKVLVLLENPYGAVESCSVDCPADGFLLLRNITLAILSDAILRLMQGQMPVPPEVARELLASARRGESNRATGATLTPREQQVLNLMARGFGNKQIAKHLGISEHGVKRHVSNVLARLNSPNRTTAVAKAIREGLIQETEPDRHTQ
jgi:two-component system, NarL family, nitrate/nitrite response regulator NarL